jgi:hypothetical protein
MEEEEVEELVVWVVQEEQVDIMVMQMFGRVEEEMVVQVEIMEEMQQILDQVEEELEQIRLGVVMDFQVLSSLVSQSNLKNINLY